MNKEHLQGDAARDALADIVAHWRDSPWGSLCLTEYLLTTGRIVVLPEAEPLDPPCVARIMGVFTEVGRGMELEFKWGVAISLKQARALHAASLCPCAATALLRRWDTSGIGTEAAIRTQMDTRAFLGQTAAQCPGPGEYDCECDHGRQGSHTITAAR